MSMIQIPSINPRTGLWLLLLSGMALPVLAQQTRLDWPRTFTGQPDFEFTRSDIIKDATESATRQGQPGQAAAGGQSELANGYLESVNHLYSMEKKQGPIVLKVRVPRNNPRMPSLVPVYRGAEYQEREAYDLFGIVYEGHPDLRRILMWDEFEGHPMRKDYVEEDQDVR